MPESGKLESWELIDGNQSHRDYVTIRKPLYEWQFVILIESPPARFPSKFNFLLVMMKKKPVLPYVSCGLLYFNCSTAFSANTCLYGYAEKTTSGFLRPGNQTRVFHALHFQYHQQMAAEISSSVRPNH
jgi:hypothetical protein